MTGLLNDFVTYLKAGLTKPPVFYTDIMLDEVGRETAVAVYEYTGSTGIPQVEAIHRSIQIAVRGKKHQEAKNIAFELYKMLRTEDGIIFLTPQRWGTINLRQSPFKLKVDEKGRPYYAFNLGITTYLE